MNDEEKSDLKKEFIENATLAGELKPTEYVKDIRHSEKDKTDKSEEDLLNCPSDLSPEEIDAILGPESYTHSFSKCLQPLINPVTYLAAMSFTSLTTGFFYYYSTSTITTLERRFGLSSQKTGIITTGNDIISVLFSIPLGFLAGRGHRPRWLASGIFLGVVACVLADMPHFVFGSGKFGDPSFFEMTLNNTDAKKSNTFNDNGTIANDCDSEDSTGNIFEQNTVVTLQFLAQMLLGFSNIQLYVAGYSYLDDAVSKEMFPLYLGTAGMLRVCGPVVSTAISTWSLGLWIDPSLTPNITPKHPQWVGAWWLGYLIIGASMSLAIFPVIIMPKMLPSTRQRQIKRLRIAAKEGKEKFQKEVETLRPPNEKGFKGLSSSFRRLMKNGVFNLICLNQFMFWMGVVVFFIFTNKYMEHQFQLSASEASKYTGIVGIVSTLVGWMVGGCIMTFGQPKPRNVIILTVGISATLIAFYAGLMSFTCDIPDVIGLDLQLQKNHPTISNSSHMSELDKCISKQLCINTYLPVCVTIKSEDTQIQKHNFYSACYAGCLKEVAPDESGIKQFAECECVDALLKDGEKIVSVKSGECLRDCPSFYPFLMLKSTIGIFMAINRVIANAIFFRSLEERDKDLGLSILNVMICVGLIIGPILCGQAIDWTCKLWEVTCGVQQSCKLYNIDQFRYILHLVPAVSIGVGMVMEIMLFYYKDTIVLYDENKNTFMGALTTIRNKFFRSNKVSDISATEEKQKS